MTTTIPSVTFSEENPDDGWSDQPIPDVGITAPQPEDQGDPDDDPAGAGALAVDPEAPWGRFKNGKPKKKPRASAAPGRRVPPSPRRTTRTTKTTTKAAAAAGPDYEQMSLQGIREAVALGGLAANALKSTAIAADVVMVDLQAENIARISADFAEEEPRWGQALQRLTAVGKWSGPVSLAIAMGVQACVNHGLLPAGLMGSRPPGELLDLAEKRAAIAQAAADQAALRSAA